MQCYEIHELFADYVDGVLPEDQQDILREHLAKCLVCQRDLRMYDHVVVSLASLPLADPPAGLRERLHSAINEEAARSVGAARSVAAQPRRYATAAAIGALAAVIVLLLGYIWLRVAAVGPEPIATQPPSPHYANGVAPSDEAPSPPTEVAEAPPGGDTEAGAPANALADARGGEASDIDKRLKEAVAERPGLGEVQDEGAAPPEPRLVPVGDRHSEEIGPSPAEGEPRVAQPPSTRINRGEFDERGPAPLAHPERIAEGPGDERPAVMGPESGTEKITGAVNIEIAPRGKLRAGKTGEVEISIWTDEPIRDAEIVVKSSDNLRVVGASDTGKIYGGELAANRTNYLIEVTPGKAGSGRLSVLLRWDHGKRLKRSPEVTLPILPLPLQDAAPAPSAER